MNFYLKHTQNMKIENYTIENYVIEINQECCICLDYLNLNTNKLECCNNEIHNKCIYDIFVHESVIDNKVIFTCPLCRTQQNFKSVVSLKEIKKYTNDLEIINKYKLHNINKYIEICKLLLEKFIITFFFLIIIYIIVRVFKISKLSM